MSDSSRASATTGVITDWRPEDTAFWQSRGEPRSQPEPVDLRSLSTVSILRLDVV